MKTTGKTLLKGSQITIKCLELLGVEVVFAYPGGQAIELHQALIDSDLRVVLPRHEQGGAFAAGGYARATGRVGVAMATSGPGATNLVSGIADAYMDSVPTVFITGQVSSRMIGKNVFQETDIIGVTRPIVKHSFLVLDAAELPEIMRRAFEIAASGRPGPVVVDIPKNIQQQICEFDPAALKMTPEVRPAPSESEIAEIRRLIAESVRPCVYAGGGIISSGENLYEIRSVSPRRVSPASAKIKAPYSPLSSFASRVNTFPRTGLTFHSGCSF